MYKLLKEKKHISYTQLHFCYDRRRLRCRLRSSVGSTLIALEIRMRVANETLQDIIKQTKKKLYKKRRTSRQLFAAWTYFEHFFGTTKNSN